MVETETRTREKQEGTTRPAPRKRTPTAPRTADTPNIVPPIPARRAAPRKREVYYPTGDGKPMAEHSANRNAMAYSIDAGKIATSHRARVWVSGNDFVYYQEGNPKARVSPDCYIVLDVPRGERAFFKIWEEGRVPNVVWEFTSKKTKREDQTTKRKLYESLGVKEYILFDPRNEYLKPRLQGYRLVEGKYQPMQLDALGRLTSEETGIVMYPDGQLLRFLHPVTGVALLTQEEADAHNSQLLKQKEEERQRADEERQRAERERQRAELEATHANEERKRAEQETARAEEQQQRAEQETARAEEQQQRAEQEAARANRAEEELARLREQLAQR